jgi:hypothetical protein
MSDEDLEQRLRAHFRALDPGPPPSEVVESVAGLLDEARRPRVTPVRLASAAAGLAAVALAAAALILGSQPGGWLAGPPGSPTSSATSPASVAPPTQPSTPRPSSTPSLSGGFRWQTVAPAPFGGSQLTDITALTDGYLAAGVPGPQSGTVGTSQDRPSLWRSTDGLAWSQMPDSPAFVEPTSGWADRINGLAAGPSKSLVAVGEADNGDASSFQAVAWASRDGGQTWQRAIVGGPDDAAMNDVVATASGFVAVGIDGHPSGGTQMIGVRGAAVWVSADGLRWTRVASSSVLAGAYMTRVINDGTSLVAIGADAPTGAGTSEPPIWTSPNGLRWAHAQLPASAAASLEVDAIATSGSIVVAVGSAELADQSYAWTSADGRTWQRHTISLVGPGTSRQVIGGVASVGSRWLLLSWNPTGAGCCQGGPLRPAPVLLWESSDGVSWQSIAAVSALAGASPYRIAAGPPGLLVLGVDQTNASGLWLATAAGP